MKLRTLSNFCLALWVAPHVGAWIETDGYKHTRKGRNASHPTWVRGLKPTLNYGHYHVYVAPHVGAWIETGNDCTNYRNCCVAPHVGAWIETSTLVNRVNAYLSHPTWMRGLKHFRYSEIEEPFSVAPHVGAWIETFFVETCRTYKQVAPHVGACVSLNTI